MTSTCLYVHNAIWRLKPNGFTGDCTNVTPNFLVYNVQSYSQGFIFTLNEESDEYYWCHYPWAFVVADDANLQAWDTYSELRAKAHLANQAALDALKLVRTIA